MGSPIAMVLDINALGGVPSCEYLSVDGDLSG